jgi:hypothetical protein
MVARPSPPPRPGARVEPTADRPHRSRGARRSLCCSEGIYDPAYSGQIVIPGRTLGFCVSLLGPCYGIHRTGAPGEEPAALDLAREIEVTYPGYEPIPLELGNEVVPDVCSDGQYFGKATIYNCLLSEEWERSSRPYDGVRSRDYVEPPDDPGAPDAGAADVGLEVHIHWKDRRD